VSKMAVRARQGAIDLMAGAGLREGPERGSSADGTVAAAFGADWAGRYRSTAHGCLAAAGLRLAGAWLELGVAWGLPLQLGGNR